MWGLSNAKKRRKGWDITLHTAGPLKTMSRPWAHKQANNHAAQSDSWRNFGLACRFTRYPRGHAMAAGGRITTVLVDDAAWAMVSSVDCSSVAAKLNCQRKKKARLNWSLNMWLDVRLRLLIDATLVTAIVWTEISAACRHFWERPQWDSWKLMRWQCFPFDVWKFAMLIWGKGEIYNTDKNHKTLTKKTYWTWFGKY